MRIRLYIVLLACVLKAGAQSPFGRVRLFLSSGGTAPKSIFDSCRSRSLMPDSVLYYEGLVALKAEKIDVAEVCLAQLKKQFPDFKEMHYLNGMISFMRKKYGKSIDEFALAIESNPLHVNAYFNRSVAYGLLDDYKPAIADLSKCIELDKTYALAYYSRAYWFEYTESFDEALKDYESCIKLDPKNYDAYLGMAYIYKNRKDNTKACEVIKRAQKAGSQIADEIRAGFCD